MIVVCAGMYRSGSTWQYQVACEVLRRSGRAVCTEGYLEGSGLSDFLARPCCAGGWHVFKTHPPAAAVATNGPAGVRVLYSYRDLRDVAYSLAYKLGVSFRQAVDEQGVVRQCLAADAFWRGLPGVLLQRYEDWVDDQRPAVRAIAAHLGVELSAAEAAAVAAEFSLTRNRERTTDLARQLAADGVNLSDPVNALRYDPDSLLHWNHIRSGVVGGWRAVASPTERGDLAAACQPWLEANGYETDRRWVSAARC